MAVLPCPVDQPEVSLLTLVDRLARMEGLLVGLQASITQSQAQVTGFLSRVESLERRLVDLEKAQVTRADLEALGQKVDALTVSEARQNGGTGALTWVLPLLISLVAAAAAISNALKIETRTPLPPAHDYPAEQSR